MKIILAQCKKELLQFLRYRLTVALAFLLPLILLFVYGFAIRLESKNIPLIIQDFDKSPLSRDYIDRFKASTQFKLLYPRLINGKYGSESNLYIQKALDNGIAKVGIIIPPDFTRKIKQDKTCNVQVMVDGTDVVNAKVVQNSIPVITDFFLAENNLQKQGLLIVSDIRVWFNPGRKESLFIVPGVFTVALALFPAILATIAMSREKEEGSLIQIFSSGLKAEKFIFGKMLAYLTVAVCEAVFIISIGTIVFGLRLIGSPIVFLLGTLVFLSANVMFGLMAGIVADTQRSAIQLTGITMALSVILLSGFIYPISNIPFPLSLLSYIVPARYYMEIIRSSFVRGSGFSGTWFLIPEIALVFLLEFFIARRKLRKMQFL